MRLKGFRFLGFQRGQRAVFNGMPVLLIRPIAAHDGQTWLVLAMDNQHAGEGPFSIDVSLLHLLEEEPNAKA